MKPTWMFVAVAALLNLSSSLVTAVGPHCTESELSLQLVLENREGCIREICGDKIYLNTDRISISVEGTYLN